jgi:GNAT superfamily N-acetyltransferase
MLIRAYDEDDLDRIGWVHSRSRQAAYAGLVPAEALAEVTPERQAMVWRTRIGAITDRHALFVAEIDGLVVGFTFGQVEGEQPELKAIHVLAQQHGAGIGQALHDRMVEEFRSWGSTRAHLWVVDGNERAQAFYRRNGWRHDGTRSRHDVAGAEIPILGYRLDLDGPPPEG